MIEKAAESDLEEILSLQKLAFQSEAELYGDYQIPPLMQSLEELAEEYSLQIILKESIVGRIIGSVRGVEIQPGVCYVGRLIVHPEYQNRRIGKNLMKSIEAYFAKCSRFILTTGSKSIKNIHLYENLGYSIVREQKINNLLTLVHMEKNKIS